MPIGSASGPPGPAAPLTRPSRSWRLGVSAAVLGLVALGTVVGQDDWFPVGPFRMYATATSPDAAVTTLRVVGVTAGGETVDMPTQRVLGLRRAELEGQAPVIRHNPEMLGALEAAYRRAAPGTPELVEVRLVGTRRQMSDGRTVGEPVERVVASWPVAP